ncbi:2-amino-4-hydroxy-6-hydroxymethyldihydropteridine diphosphokinase [Paenibacillus caseinilyticus]|uniref:2-amino-4-hydroxy-6-hydroxymethyldihydropteridine diphosphokinase n=1 Tax=Paenibacillus mucilaginosus K02 TaxID=997761 RepID=I0BUH3_9BACL|nr:2-amino-4-hydroxy-6-hydroxymethyldihydropteridine diphosphokinase [Paenibacillus mucilaginosus]AFH66020.1 2-amino-4-hydroxy-6-hydroxymethyldihydropteridine pyrophosphokinase [Paenibacillus mucilaginosus K02]
MMNEEKADIHSQEDLAVAYIGLGSNLGDREQYLKEALRMLEEHPEIRILGLSSFYETDPVGYVDQDPFLNMVAAVGTTLSPEDLFAQMLGAEQHLGRKREVRWGPRTIDLDLLLYGSRTQEDPRLILPHPRMMERAFVLIPLIEVMKAQNPQQTGALEDHLRRLSGKEGVTLWKRMQ